MGWCVEVHYGTTQSVFANWEQYNVVLNLLDWLPELFINSGVPKERLVMAVRSNLYEKMPEIYQNAKLLQRFVGAVVVANAKQYEVFKYRHKNVWLAPGGVDTEIFTPSDKPLRDKPIVGWAGSRDNFGVRYRGIPLVSNACQKLGLKYLPAYREERWRSEKQMVDYYQNDIDIYVDLSVAAGRQNGLLEAGACGKVLISSDAGIAPQLIEHGENGFLINRDELSLCEVLKKCTEKNTIKIRKNVRKEINRNWTWKVQATLFQSAFESIIQ